MELILIILTSAVLSAFFVICFYAGYKFGLEKKKDDSLEMNDSNIDAIKGMAEWMNYRG